MIEKPHIPDEQISASLCDDYGLPDIELTFLPVGNDSRAWAYSVRARNGQRYFLKVRCGPVYPPALSVPGFLRDSGVEPVVAPLPTTAQGLSSTLGDFSLILYPFVDGGTGAETGMSESQWGEFGAVLRHIHATVLPCSLHQQMRKETFVPKWSRMVREVQTLVETCKYMTPAERELAAFWMSKNAEIEQIVTCAEELGRRLQDNPPPQVLCHADIHAWNILIDRDNRLYIVDWDEVILAPKERDLMFVIEDTDVSNEHARHAHLFFEGYGVTPVDALVIAYYRYEWVIQEIGDYGERVFLAPDSGEQTQRDAVAAFQQLFDPGDVVDSAYRSSNPGAPRSAPAAPECHPTSAPARSSPRAAAG